MDRITEKRPTSLPFRAKQSLGQNFLRDANIARKIVRSLQPAAEGTILEIGPGLGALTAPLLETFPGCRIVAVEIDRRCVEFLQDRFAECGALTVIERDILNVDLREIAGDQPVSVIGNLSYHATSPVLFRLFDHLKLIREVVVMVQREVADRIAAEPGTRTRGVLSVFTQYHTAVERLFTVHPPAFIPRPEVDSAVVRLTPQSGPVLSGDLEVSFRCVVKTAFQQRRKKLANSLKALLGDTDFPGLDRRPETLTVEEFIVLAELAMNST